VEGQSCCCGSSCICVPDICWLRLDFETFTILGTGLTTESNGGLCLDTFKVTVSAAQMQLL
jgi:hypothetical protein